MNRSKHVIYRSKGCRNCRARKVKCDETRPVCMKCIKGRLQCQGYTQPTTFIIENPQTERGSPSSLPVSRQPSEAASEGSSWLVEPQSLPYPPESRYIAFLVNKLAIGTPGDGKGFSWLSHGLAMTDKNNVLYSSSRCLAEVFYGQNFRQQSVVANGMCKYGKILQYLAQEFEGATGIHRGDLILVILACMITESIAPPPTSRLQLARGMHAHVAGLAQIICAGGPQPFRLQRDIMLFNVCRSFIVAVAIVKRHNTFFAAAEWKTVPWKYLRKGLLMELWDILCDIPSLLSDLERRKVVLINWPTLEFMTPAGSVDDFSARLTFLVQSLFTWRWEWERQHSGSAKNISLDASETLAFSYGQNPQHATFIDFNDISRAKEILYYNATLALLLRVGKGLIGDVLCNINSAAPLDLTQPLQPSPLLLPSEIRSVEDVTSEFYRSMEGHLHSRQGLANDTLLLSFSLSLAYLGTEQGSRDALKVIELRKKIIETSGFTLWAPLQKKD